MRVSFLLLVWLVAVPPFSRAEETSVTRMIGEDTDRVPSLTVAPVYPKDARRDRVEGEVQVCYHIDKKGRPYRIAVRESTHRAFERPSINAVKASRYLPLKPDEKHSGIKTCRTFRFQLVSTDAESFAARSVFDINMTMVMGPTPPGTGVTAAATPMASS
jgi:TonB family protein